MHTLVDPNDPVIQLSFNNPLNTSVQLGDIAYFANTIAVGGSGLQHAQIPDYLNDAPPPHETAGQQDIIKIGVIVEIQQFDETLTPPSFIRCSMPQELFNQYFGQISGSACETFEECTDDCDRTVATYAWTSYPGGPTGWGPRETAINNSSPNGNDLINFFFDNPTFHVDDYKFHHWSNPLGANYPKGLSSVCQVVPSNYDPQNGLYFNNIYDNVYHKVTNIVVSWDFYSQSTLGGSYNNNHANIKTANEALDLLMTALPNQGLQLGMSYLDIVALNAPLPNPLTHPYTDPDYIAIGLQTAAITDGRCSSVQGDCDVGSFIMFSKDNKANQSDLLGYHSLVEYRNNSKTEAELYNVGASFYESSK